MNAEGNIPSKGREFNNPTHGPLIKHIVNILLYVKFEKGG